MKQPLTRFFTDFLTILPHAYSSWRREFLDLKLFFVCLFVLGGCVAWIFVFNSSWRIKRRKNPTLLAAYAASPEVWDINTVCFLYGFPKGTENVMRFNWLFHVFSALVKQQTQSWDEKEHLWLNHGAWEQIGRKEQPPRAVQASGRFSERRSLWGYVP